jgi:hypothetical protein
LSEIHIVMAGSGGRSLVAEFYSRDTTDRWIEIKEDLYTRLQEAKEYAERLKKHVAFDPYDGGLNDGELNAVREEIEFLQGIIDKIERS